MTKNKKLFKTVGFLLVIIIAAFLINKFNIFKDYGPSEIRDYILARGKIAPLIYVALLSILPLVLFPDSVLVIAGGMIFGLVNGVILTSIGSLIGGVIAFLISRYLGREVVRKFIKKDLVSFHKSNTRRSFFLILVLRLIPLFPFKIVSYSAGLSNMRLIDFSLATLIGSLPGIIVYTNIGDKTNEVGSSGFYLSIILLIVLIVGSFFLKKLYAKKGDDVIEQN